MDDRSFDRLARLLGEASNRRTGLKALVGGLIGAGGLAALDADAKRKHGADAEKRKHRKKRRKCTPACEAGFTCIKGRCTCASGVTCAGACCAAGQTCRDGGCAEPLGACLEFGDACKGVGRRCCDRLTCASGQDGSYPVACYRGKGAACASIAECPFGMTCTGGVCLGSSGGIPTGQPCASGAKCDQPGATCTAYTGDDAPAGDFCTLPLRKVCTGNPDCTCYNCWYVNGGAEATSRAGRSSTNVKACCHPPGESCTSENDCCHNLECSGGVCTGTTCVPEGGACTDGPCCGGASCQGGVCAGGGGCAFPVSNLSFGANCCEDSQCATGLCWYPQDSSGYPVAGPVGLQKVCRVAVGATCSYATYGYYDQCGLGTYCDYGPTPNVCSDSESYPLTVPTGGTGCDANHPCAEEDLAYCSAGTCVARTPRAIKEPCDPATDVCPENASCQTYSDGIGSGAPTTTTTYCLGDPYSYKTTDPLSCASLRTYPYSNGEGCTYKCKVYLDADGATGSDASAAATRGAALKRALESFVPIGGQDWFYIEPDTLGANDRTYVTQQISLTTPNGASIVLCTCLGTGPNMPRPMLSGNGANRVLDVTVAGDSGITIQYVDFENGSATGDGGAIRIDSTGKTGSREVAISIGAITGSTATGNGGGLATVGSATVSDVVISGCTATGNGGGWHATTTGTQQASLSYGASITGNTASGGSSEGAGLFWSGDSSQGWLCPQNANASVASNTDSGTKFDCAFGATPTNWLFCGCATGECAAGETWNPTSKFCEV